MDIKKLFFAVISSIIIIGLILLLPMDYFCHGFYCESVGYDNIDQGDYLEHVDLSEGAFETTFSPLKNHFAGFEIFLENIPDDRSGDLAISTYTLQGKLIETKEVAISEVSPAGWYMVYLNEKYKKDTVYRLIIDASKCESAPGLLLVDNDYLTGEGMGNNLLIGYAYAQSTFSNVEKVLIFLFAVSIWIMFLSALYLKNARKRKAAGKTALILGITVLLSWNYMFNSFDEENAERFSSFQFDSDALVTGNIEAAKDGIEQSYGLGRYYVTRGEYNTQTEFVNDDSWLNGYSTMEPRIKISKNEYTKLFAATGTMIQFDNRDMLTVTETTEEGEYYIFTLNSPVPLNYYKYGDLGNAIFYSSEGGILNRYPNGVLEPYEAQYGLQGRVFQYLAQYMSEDNYEVYLELICSLATALVFSLIIVLIRVKYNSLFAACFAAVFLLSPWLVNFAGSVYWVEFTWFVPMLIGLVCAIWIDSKWIRRVCYIIAYVSIMIKSLCGYEYISTIMMGLISFLLIDLSVSVMKKDRQKAVSLSRTVFIIGCAALAGFVTAVCIHASIRGDGNMISGIRNIVSEDVLRRAGGGSLNSFGQEYWPSLNASVWEVIRKYFHFKTDIIVGLDANIFPTLCILPIVIFVHDYVKKNFNFEEAAMYIVFFLTGMSWIILGKSHSYIHTHLNFVLWYFGFVQCCIYIILNKFVNYINVKKSRNTE